MARPTIVNVISILFFGITLYSSTAYTYPLGWSASALAGETIIVDDVGNQWLSPTATLGMSYNDAIASTWVVDHGFQSVGASQFVGLLSAYGLPSMSVDVNGNGFIDTPEYNSGYGLIAKSFVLDFGHTYHATSPNWGVTRTWGYLSPDSDPTMAGIGLVGLLVTNGTNYGGVESGQRSIDATVSNDFFGTWLFNSATSSVNTISEPGASMLIALGFVNMLWLRRRQRR